MESDGGRNLASTSGLHTCTHVHSHILTGVHVYKCATHIHMQRMFILQFTLYSMMRELYFPSWIRIKTMTTFLLLFNITLEVLKIVLEVVRKRKKQKPYNYQKKR